MNKREESIQEKIDKMVRRIVKKFKPEKIILFGSYARGTPTRDSDVDLLIIMPVSQNMRLFFLPYHHRTSPIGQMPSGKLVPKKSQMVSDQSRNISVHISQTASAKLAATFPLSWSQY